MKIVRFELSKDVSKMFDALVKGNSMLYGSTPRQVFGALVKVAYEKMVDESLKSFVPDDDAE